MTWEEVCADKTLQDLPYKIELNRHGKIIMSPASIPRIVMQSKIYDLLKSFLKEGFVLMEASIDTDQGVKVADVVYATESFIEKFGHKTSFPLSPPLCVEVISPSNTEEEMGEKRALYFSQGAKEVWICDLSGKMDFYLPTGKEDSSELLPDFPNKVA